MAGRGPAPKPPEQRVRRNADAVPFTVLGREPIKDAPRLGPKPSGGAWLKATREWFETWRRSPQAGEFIDTDWNVLRRCALLLDQFYRDPTASLAGEIRQIEAKLGATMDDRMRLRLRVHSRPVPEPAEAESGVGRPRLSVAPDPRRAVSA